MLMIVIAKCRKYLKTVPNEVDDVRSLGGYRSNEQTSWYFPGAGQRFNLYGVVGRQSSLEIASKDLLAFTKRYNNPEDYLAN